MTSSPLGLCDLAGASQFHAYCPYENIPTYCTCRPSCSYYSYVLHQGQTVPRDSVLFSGPLHHLLHKARDPRSQSTTGLVINHLPSSSPPPPVAFQVGSSRIGNPTSPYIGTHSVAARVKVRGLTIHLVKAKEGYGIQRDPGLVEMFLLWYSHYANHLSSQVIQYGELLAMLATGCSKSRPWSGRTTEEGRR